MDRIPVLLIRLSDDRRPDLAQGLEAVPVRGRHFNLSVSGLAPLQSRTDSEVISPAAMAGGNTGLVLCQVGGQ
jgi:hypothetical protein